MKNYKNYTDIELEVLDFYQPNDKGIPLLQELFYRFFVEKFGDVNANILKFEDATWFKILLIKYEILDIVRGVTIDLDNLALVDALYKFNGHPTLLQLEAILGSLFVDADINIDATTPAVLNVSILSRPDNPIVTADGELIITNTADFLVWGLSAFAVNPELFANILAKLVPTGVKINLITDNT